MVKYETNRLTKINHASQETKEQYAKRLYTSGFPIFRYGSLKALTKKRKISDKLKFFGYVSNRNSHITFQHFFVFFLFQINCVNFKLFTKDKNYLFSNIINITIFP